MVMMVIIAPGNRHGHGEAASYVGADQRQQQETNRTSHERRLCKRRADRVGVRETRSWVGDRCAVLQSALGGGAPLARADGVSCACRTKGAPNRARLPPAARR